LVSFNEIVMLVVMTSTSIWKTNFWSTRTL